MGWKAAMVSGLALILVVSAVASGIFLLAPSNPVSASFIRAQPGSVPWNGKQLLNVLFLGLDDSRSHATALAVASYNPQQREVRILPLPPSMWVSIPGFGQDRIANAYTDGGPRLSLLTAESVTRTVIPYYMALDSSTFRQLVDSYGGISVDGAAQGRPWDGQRTLAYMAGGAAGRGGEAERMQRDASVARAVLHAAVLPTNLLQVVSLINDLGGRIDTNFPYSRVPSLLRGLTRAKIRSDALDESNGAVAQYQSSSGPVLLPDWQRISTTVRSLLPAQRGESGLAEVLNGSGTPGQAATLATWLRGMGFRVPGVGSADSFNYAHTMIVMNEAASRSDLPLARSLSAVLQAPIVTRRVQTSKAPVVVIIGADYQDVTQQ